MKKSMIILIFLSLSMLACSSDTPTTNGAANAVNANIANTNIANTNIINAVNNAVTNSPSANVPQITDPEKPAMPPKEAANQPKTNVSNKETKSNTNTKKQIPNEADRNVDSVLGNQNGTVKKETKKLKKNVENILKELP